MIDEKTDLTPVKKVRKKSSKKVSKKRKIEKVDSMPETDIEQEVCCEPDAIYLNETQILKYRLINTQFSLVQKSVEAADMKKQMCLSEQRIVVESYNDFKKAISNEHNVNFDNYSMDLEKGQLVKKPELE